MPQRSRGSASSSWPRDPTPRHACGPFAPNRAESRWENGSIWTITTFDVVETFKGSLPRQIAVRLPGGRVGHLISTVEGAPKFAPGNEAVVFLQQSPAGRIHHRGMGSGEFPNFARCAKRRRNRDAGFQRLRGFRRVLYPDPTDSVHVGAISGRVLPANPLALPATPAGVTGIFPA